MIPEIAFTEFLADHIIPEDGKYLVRTISTNLKTIQYLQARCHRQWNEKYQRFETSIDVSNQRVTHISKDPL